MTRYRYFRSRSIFQTIPGLCLALMCAAITAAHAQTIPFQYRGHIYVNATINGAHKASLLLDTGADGLLLDEQYFNSTGMVINRSQQAQLPGAGSTPQVITVVLDPMAVQIDTLQYFPPYVPLLDLRSIVGEKADGILGPNFLQPFLTEIDFERAELALHADTSVLSGFESIRLEVRNNRYYLPASVDLAEGIVVQGLFQLDLGNSGTACLTAPTAQAYDLAGKIPNKLKFFNLSGGAGGRTDGFQCRARAVTIGQTTLIAPHIDWSTDEGGALARPDYAGLLGNVLLERFRVILDFRRGMLYLKPRPNLNEPFIGTVSGMTIVNKSATLHAVVVTGLFEGGNADQAGIRAGDRIIAIEGKNVTELEEEALDDLLRKPGNPVELLCRRDDKTFTVMLRREEKL